ncbi:hypothetical protein OKA04_04620 [Luteolibacter flavescens]|uniref:Helix-turn-helix domain-containing protein n=1 Tax=Luteolibacter flavescens TaxID=1859460 RepID=A0ABT3FKC6_9BACT|nr:hypothetical protein [Luteolibacter flavescens]MCW1884000.1 hypothetical protein [Luteolibacter flavescens]
MDAKPEQLSLSLVWESELVRSGDGSVTLRATRPLSEVSAKRAAKMLCVSEWTIQKLWRLGELEGYKPGGVRRRKDGRGSNARLVLDAGSVLAYKARQQAEAKREQACGLW